MPDLNAIRARRTEITGIAQRSGAREVRVFGSVARGEANDASDVDLLVTMDQGRTLFDIGGLLVELEELLGCRVDAVTEGEISNSETREAILREAVPL